MYVMMYVSVIYLYTLFTNLTQKKLSDLECKKPTSLNQTCADDDYGTI